jgi:hypothetical protein
MSAVDDFLRRLAELGWRPARRDEPSDEWVTVVNPKLRETFQVRVVPLSN